MCRKSSAAAGKTRPLFALVAALPCLALACTAGCQSWPFRHRDRTAMITPAMRMATVREAGARARDEGPDEQQAVCAQLAQQIQTEPDPIVRGAIQEAVAGLDAPLASQILTAGLQDENRRVRMTCCRELGRRGETAAIDQLAQLVRADEDFDVRMAAVDALGNIKTEASVIALAAALKDRDPAMQYAGVQAMRGASGQDLGNDVQAWRQYAATLQAPGENREIAVAAQPDSSKPY
ncbi:MAG: HEAT repeat domain-containing protein [Planctomycetales bacterium]|nr:HEAT repeat domain-containing protein [Planctomycetales bacterium]